MLSGLIATGTQVSQLLLADKGIQTIHTLTRLCLTVCFFANSLPGQHCSSGPGCGSSAVLSPFSASISIILSSTHIFTQPPCVESALRAWPSGWHWLSWPPTQAAASRLASHSACTGQVCSSPALCQPSHPGTTSRPGASRTSIAPPGCLHPHFCCGVISPWPQSLESWMLLAAGNSNFISPDLLDCKGPSSPTAVCKRAGSSVRTEAKGGPPQNWPFSPEFSTSLAGIGPSRTCSKWPCVTRRFSVCLWSDGWPNKGLSITPTRRRLTCVSK